MFKRSSGVLLHPTSLPSPFGVGDLGPEAYRFADFLARSGQSIWQVLPLGPTGYGDSPYQCFSAFAGNPILISPEKLVQVGLLSAADIEPLPAFPAQAVDYDRVNRFKLNLLRRAFATFREKSFSEQQRESFSMQGMKTAEKYSLDRYIMAYTKIFHGV